MFTVNFVIIASSGKSETLIETVLEFPLCPGLRTIVIFDDALYVRLPVAANAVIEVVSISAITITIAKNLLTTFFVLIRTSLIFIFSSKNAYFYNSKLILY